jgi:hypothetical protein
MGKLKEKRPLERPQLWWVDIISTDLGDVIWIGVNWTSLAQDSDKCRVLVGAIMNFGVP